MASPDTDNGFTRVANELAEQFARRDFSKRAYAVLWVVLRFTYGYQRTTYPHSNRAIADATGMHISHVRDTVASLAGANVLLLDEGMIGLNKNYDLWAVLDRTKTALDQAHQNGSPESQNSTRTKTAPAPKQRASESQNSAPRRAVLVRGTPSTSSNDAALQDPKERKKERNVEEDLPLYPPGGQTTASQPKGAKEWSFSEADLEVMKGISFGMIGPAQMPHRLGMLVSKRVQAEENEPGVVPAYYALPASKVAAWVKVAIAMAEEKAKIRTNEGKLRFAASVIANALEAGKDLTGPVEASNVVSFQAAQAAAADAARKAVDPRFVGKPYAGYWTAELVGTTCDREYLMRLADRAKHYGGTCDRWTAEDIWKAEGIIAAMDYVWAHDPANKSRANVTA